MKKALRLAALFVMVAMVAAMAIVPASADEVPNNVVDGKFNIGFFEKDGVIVPNIIEIRTAVAFAAKDTFEFDGVLSSETVTLTFAETNTVGRALETSTSIINPTTRDTWAATGIFLAVPAGTTFMTIEIEAATPEALIGVFRLTSVDCADEFDVTFTNASAAAKCKDVCPDCDGCKDPDNCDAPDCKGACKCCACKTFCSVCNKVKKSNLCGKALCKHTNNLCECVGKVPGINTNYPVVTTTAANNTGVPRGGVALAIIPTLIAAGAAVVASRKRK